MSRSPRIAVVGSANVDLTTFVHRFPRPGETVFGREFRLGFGGKGANQAVAARRCGADVLMVARVGDDLFGPASIEHLEAEGIDTAHMRVIANASTGVAPILVDETGQNSILVVKGANDLLTPADVDHAAKALSQADCIVLQLEIPLETVYYTIELARSQGIRCILNPAPGQRLELARIASVDYLIPNESEAEVIGGIAVQNSEDAAACAAGLLDRGLQRVVITLGEQGALVAGTDGTRVVPPFPVETIDTTGAGDAFIGSFATFLAEGRSEGDALEWASLYAALSTTQVGTQTSFLDRAAFEKERDGRLGGS
jgi:ribokinase